VQFSEYFGGWNAFNSTITNNDTTSPEGLANAAKLAEDSSLAFHDADFSFTFSAVSNVFSVFAKANGRDKIFLQQFDGGTFHSSDVFDLTNGTYAGGNEGSIEDFGNGWFRCSYVKTTAAGSGKLYINLHNGTSGNYQGDGTSGVYLYGAQLEANATYASSYIPNHSGTGGVTRAADSCSVTGVSDVIGQTEGTIYAEVNFDSSSTNYEVGFAISDSVSASTKHAWIGRNNSNRLAAFLTNIGSQLSYTPSSGGIISTGNHKIALSYASNDAVVYIDGAQVASSSSVSVPTMNTAELGLFRGAVDQADSEVKQTLVFKERLTNAELATLTTL
tara:strand:+ start:644 stop:1639 length:996 start_codon:yes stop_codon:yes gene_type:complete